MKKNDKVFVAFSGEVEEARFIEKSETWEGCVVVKINGSYSVYDEGRVFKTRTAALNCAKDMKIGSYEDLNSEIKYVDRRISEGSLALSKRITTLENSVNRIKLSFKTIFWLSLLAFGVYLFMSYGL